MFSKMVFFQTIKKPGLYLSLLLGAIFGLFIYCYWLIDLLPPMSKRIFAYTGFASIAAAVGYFFLLEKWLVPRISEMTKTFQWQFIVCSVIGGIFLMVLGTEAWEKPTRSLVFLLPSQSLKISVPSQPQIPSQTLSISLLQTSIGNISLNDLDYHGWKRINNALVLKDWSNNTLKWKGKTGKKVMIVFKALSPGARVSVSWNGDTQDIVLTPDKGGKHLYGHKFDIPSYASRSIVLFLAIFNFTLISAVIISFIWHKRNAIVERFSESMTYRSGKKENKNLELVVVIGLLFLTIALRVFNLDVLPPYIDEYFHINAARDILSGVALSTVYQRGLWIVTLPVTLAFRLFGTNLWVARFVGVLFNVSAVVPLLLITKRINKPVAIISAILYATSPWIIATSRTVREYAYYPFYYYWIVYGLILVIGHFPNRFSLTRDARKLFKPQLLFLSLILLLPFYYGIILDRQSTFNLVLGAYAVFCLIIFIKIDFRDKTTLWLLIAIGIAIVVAVYVGWMRTKLHIADTSSWSSIYNLIQQWQQNIAITPLPVTITPLRLFLTNPIQQWYYNRAMIPIALVLCSSIAVSMFFYRANSIPFLVLILYLQQLVFFVFFFNRYFRPRYLSTVQIWYVIVLAVGIYGFWLILSTLLKKSSALLVAGILIAMSFNGSHVLSPTLSNEAMPMPITVEYHGNTQKANDFLFDKVKQGDVLISTYYASYAHFVGKPVFSEIYLYKYFEQTLNDINAIVGQHNSGWIVIDDTTGIFFSKYPKETFAVNGRKVEYLGYFGNQFIWRWYILQ